MVGTTPVFYKITITAALSKAVQTGTYPETETRVLRYIPALPRRNSEGMRPLPNRLEILRWHSKNSWETETGRDKQAKRYWNEEVCGCFFEAGPVVYSEVIYIVHLS